MAKDTSGPAFPAEQHFVDGTKSWCHGMSIGDYFAGQALVGLVMSSMSTSPPAEIASRAYLIAAAMLDQRDE